jgi:hypothetical protein
MNYDFGEAYFEYFESCNFSRENTNIDVSVFMFDLRMINMSSECEYDWNWKISACSPTNFIFWLGRLIFSYQSIHIQITYTYRYTIVVSWLWLRLLLFDSLTVRILWFRTKFDIYVFIYLFCETFARWSVVFNFK